eukprot:g24652.t1
MTLLQTATGGVSWIEVESTISGISSLLVVLFLCYFSFIYFAVLNVVTGVFCSSAIESASQDCSPAKDAEAQIDEHVRKSKDYSERLKSLFTQIDTDGTGTIGILEFEEMWEDPGLQALLSTLGINQSKAWKLFEIMDEDNNGEINAEEFVSTCFKLQGSAQRVDTERIYAGLKRVGAAIEELGGVLTDILQTVGFLKNTFELRRPPQAAVPRTSCHVLRWKHSVALKEDYCMTLRARLHVSLGKALFSEGRFPAAEASYREAAELLALLKQLNRSRRTSENRMPRCQRQTELQRSGDEHKRVDWALQASQGKGKAGKSADRARLTFHVHKLLVHGKEKKAKKESKKQKAESQLVEGTSATGARTAPGVIAEKEVFYYQSNTDLLFPKVSFQRLVREVCPRGYRMEAQALMALQEAAESFLCGLFGDTYQFCLHGRRVTIMDRDLKLSCKIRGCSSGREPS